MIKNERQYRITKAQAEKFAKVVKDTESRPPLENGLIIDAVREQLSDLQREIEEYEQLVSGNLNGVDLKGFKDLPKVLIKTRIGLGMTQAELAKKLGMKEQQVQRYEANDYGTVSLGRIMEIITVLERETL